MGVTTGLQKMFPVTVRIFDVNFNHMMKKFFDMNFPEGRDAPTAASMFDSVSLNNMNVNIGKRNSISKSNI